ncbi:MAG: DUF2974 domain-containing protein [Oscillospiraceae bacterium]|nr:DUF2974 domain-containing protein [Oscillospiraceae bacterium]
MGESVLQNGINMDEANTAFVFDTLMYSNALTDPDYEGMDIRSVVEQISVSGGLNEDESAAVAAVRTFLDTTKGQELHIGEYVLGDSSEFTSYNSEYRGAYEAVFYRDNGTSRDVFLAFKGTGDGRWFDNAVGLVTEYSPYQQKGLEFFDHAIEKLGIDSSCNLMPTGHSKGGNGAQFVTLYSKYGHLVDHVYSFDGQSPSQAAIDHIREVFGEEYYKEQCSKMYSICGDNDYVNELGPGIFSKEQKMYIGTPTGDVDFEGAHAPFRKDESGNPIPTLFDFNGGGLLPEVSRQRGLAALAKSLNKYVFSLPDEDRDAVCRSMMSVIEVALGGDSVGLNGESSGVSDYIIALSELDIIAGSLFTDLSVQKSIDKALLNFLKKPLQFKDNALISTVTQLAVTVCYYAGLRLAVTAVEIFLLCISSVASNIARVSRAVMKCKEFCSDILSIMKNGLKNLSSDSSIKCDTSALRGLADRIRNVNSRLGALDKEISGLYSKVKWTDLLDLQLADMKIGHSVKLELCANYLSDTADRLEADERDMMASSENVVPAAQ